MANLSGWVLCSFLLCCFLLIVMVFVCYMLTWICLLVFELFWL